MLNAEAKEELLDRGYSRRQLGRIATLVGAGAAIATAFRPEAAFAQGQSGRAVKGAVHIGSNECWTGPFADGVAAAAHVAANGNRYDPDGVRDDLIKTVAMVEKLPADYILAWPGSSDPLNRSVVTFASPTKGLVTADPSYESPWRTAEWLGAPLAKVPSAPGKGADVKAMLAANPNAGLYYICSPNNPTGVVTPYEDIVWLLNNKPKDAILLVDEAYIHFSDARTVAPLVVGRDDLVVLRTFSKLFGMAGMRLGLSFSSPAIQKKMMRYDGGNVLGMLPMTAVACGAAAYPLFDAQKARRAEMRANRETTIAWLTKRGVTVHPNSDANMFLVDWKTKSAKDMQAALLGEMVQIGRSWPIWPNASRVTVGSADEMVKFCAAVDKVLKA